MTLGELPVAYRAERKVGGGAVLFKLFQTRLTDRSVTKCYGFERNRRLKSRKTISLFKCPKIKRYDSFLSDFRMGIVFCPNLPVFPLIRSDIDHIPIGNIMF